MCQLLRNTFDCGDSGKPYAVLDWLLVEVSARGRMCSVVDNI